MFPKRARRGCNPRTGGGGAFRGRRVQIGTRAGQEDRKRTPRTLRILLTEDVARWPLIARNANGVGRLSTRHPTSGCLPRNRGGRSKPEGRCFRAGTSRNIYFFC